MEKSSFFNSVAGDRKYQAADFASYFNSLITNGVFPNPGTNLQVISNNNMTVTVKAGKAWINGYVYINDSDLILPIDVADGVLNRIDRIVVRFDTVGRLISTVVKKGTFASSPVAPVLQRDADKYELGIGDILISAGVITIVQGNITDLRMNTTYCGWVNSLIQADTTAIFNQYQAWFTAKQTEFNTSLVDYTTANQAILDGMEAQFNTDWDTWFATVQSALNGDIAGNLLILINDNTADLTALQDTVNNLSADAVDINITDTGNYFTSTNAEGSLQEIGLVLNAMRGGLISTTNAILGL